MQHSPQEQRLAMQKSAEVNDALQILKDPVLRADCIVALHTGESLNLEPRKLKRYGIFDATNAMARAIEVLEAQQDAQQLIEFSQQIEQYQQSVLAEISTALSAQNWQQAKMLTDRLRFIKKLQQEIERIEDVLYNLISQAN